MLSGKPTPNLAPPGNAIIDDGVWKATKSTICDLFALLNPSIVDGRPLPSRSAEAAAVAG